MANDAINNDLYEVSQKQEKLDKLAQEIKSQKQALRDSCDGFTKYFLSYQKDEPTLEEIKYWLKYYEINNENGINFFTGKKDFNRNYELNVQFVMMFLKKVYEYYIGDEYSINLSLTTQNGHLPWMDYTLVPSSFNNHELDYEPENFYKYNDKILSFRHFSWEEFDVKFRNHFEKYIKRNYFQAAGDEEICFYIPNIHQDNYINVLRFPINATFHKIIPADELNKVSDLFDVKVNHDDKFLTDCLFKLYREYINRGYNISAKGFEDLLKEMFDMNCNINDEVRKEFKGYSHLREKK